MLDPDTGRFRFDGYFELVIAGSLLVELVHVGRLEVSGAGRKMRVEVRDSSPLGDVELDEALLTVATGVFGHKVARLVHFLPSDSDLVRRLS